jgi:hypothetical protein
MATLAGADDPRLLVWAGSIPLELQLDASEVAGLSPPQPFYVSGDRAVGGLPSLYVLRPWPMGVST